MRSRHEKAVATTQTVVTARVRASQWPLPSPSTIPHEVRRRQAPGEEYETPYMAKFRNSSPRSLTLDDDDSFWSTGAPGLTASTRSGYRSGLSGTQWNRLATARSSCRQMKNQLVEVCWQLDTHIPEQATEVPKISSPEPVVEHIARASKAILQAPTPVVEYLAPVPAVFQAPVFPLSPDTSDTSSPEDEHELLGLVASQACETPAVTHGRGCPAVSRDWVSVARQGNDWRQRRRGQHCSFTCSMRASWWCGWWRGHAACITWGKRLGDWQREGRARVQVERVLVKILGPGWL